MNMNKQVVTPGTKCPCTAMHSPWQGRNFITWHYLTRRMAFLNKPVWYWPFASWKQLWRRTNCSRQGHTINLWNMPAPAGIFRWTIVRVNGLHCACSYQHHTPASPPTHLTSLPWALGCSPLPTPGSGQIFLYPVQYRKLPAKSLYVVLLQMRLCVTCSSRVTRTQIWSLTTLKTPPVLLVEKEQGPSAGLSPSHLFLTPERAWLGEPEGCWCEHPLSLWSQSQTERYWEGQTHSMPLKLHTTSSLLGPELRNVAHRLPLAEQMLLVTWTV